MTDHPTLFSAADVRALLDGSKTMTRRLAWGKPFDVASGPSYEWRDGRSISRIQASKHRLITTYVKPTVWQKVRLGDRLWARESHYVESAGYKDGSGRRILYRATVPDAPTTWTPSIHMPRWASRLTLVVTETKIESLLDISEADAEAEGFKAGMLDDGFGPREIGGGYTIESSGTLASARGMFQIAWKERHPDWDGYSSPEVVALRFVVHRSNIDAMGAAA